MLHLRRNAGTLQILGVRTGRSAAPWPRLMPNLTTHRIGGLLVGRESSVFWGVSDQAGGRGNPPRSASTSKRGFNVWH